MKAQITPSSAGPIRAPNEVSNFTDFYISANGHNDLGQPTTAIVLGQMRRFYVLNGDHSKALEAAAREGGLGACKEYFMNHIDQANKHSEHNLSAKDIATIGGDIPSW
jgi:hypothetical protein